jgi:hypothetical protein
VEQAVPLIFTSDTLPPPLRPWARLVAICVALAALSILATGATLTPTGNGISTHTQLGFPPCQWEQRMGVPCPSCGYTTSVTQFAHGNWLASLYLQPMGFVIALGCAVVFGVGGYIGVTGRPVHRLLGRVWNRNWVIALTTIAIAGWGWKIWIHLTNRDHWPLS